MQNNFIISQKFSEAKTYLASDAPYYSMLARQCAIVEDEKIETISVRENDTVISLMYNPKWCEEQTAEKLAEAIKHVLNHLVFGHIANAMFDEEDPRTEIAMDLAINSCLNKEKLPDKFIHPDDLKLPLGLSTMEYFNMLEEQHLEKCGKNPNGNNSNAGKALGDNHKFMKSTSGSSQMNSQVKTMVSNAYKQCGNQLPGGYGSGIKEMIKLMLQGAEIPWFMVLRRFIALASQIKRVRTWKRAHRRYGEDYPGYKRQQTLSVFIGLDESGSISNHEWSKFMSEIEGIYKTKSAKMTLCKFTGDVEEVIDYTGFKVDATYRFNGGTLFQPVFKEAELRRPDVVIMFTDGFNFDTPVKYGKPKSVLWVMTKDGKLSETFGSSIVLKDTTNPNMSW